MTTILSKGTTLSITVASGSPIPVNGFTDFSGVGSGTASIIDTSDLSSVAKQKALGLTDEGTAKFSLNYIEADPGQVAMETARSAGTVAHFIITLTSGTKYAFDAVVQTFEKTGSVDKIVTVSATAEITGAVTKTAAS